MFILPLSSIQTLEQLKPMNTDSTILPKSSFGAIFEDAYKSAQETQKIADQDSIDVALGKSDNLAQVMINSAKAATATQMAVELTARAVSSYKEIMQMQV